MRLIDVDALPRHEQLEPMGNGKYENIEVVYGDDIDNAPTIDAVPVVRCKDCKQLYCYEPSIEYCCDINLHGVDLMDFCSFAERKDNAE